MPEVKAVDLTGNLLGEKVTVEVRDPDTGKIRYVTGTLVEWRGVANPNEVSSGERTKMFMGRVKTPDGNGGAQVMFGPEDVLYTGDNPLAAGISEADIRKIEDEINGN